MRYIPFELIPYTMRDPRPRTFSVEVGVMLAHRDVIGLTKGVLYIEEFYRGKPVVIGKPKRYKYQRN